MKISVNQPCPCGSGTKYKKCCGVYHKGALPKTAEQLMRSRYCAFVISNSKYIMKTTHKENNDYSEDQQSWSKSIEEFSHNFEFRKLDVLEFIDGDYEAYVTFKAHIFCNGEDHSFTEKSKFFKEENMWLYHSGEFL